MENFTKRFNVRVYGVCIEDGKLLISDELQGGKCFTKLPGGGLEFGEGIGDCLRREFTEELQAEIEVKELFYVNDFLQLSAFDSNSELIVIYYNVSFRTRPNARFSETPFDFEYCENGAIAFRWIPLTDLSPTMMHFPIDKVVVNKILEREQGKINHGD